MTSTMKYTGKAKSIPEGLAIAASISMIMTIVISAILAYSLNTERITWEQAGYWIMGALFISSFVGGKSAITAIKHQKVVVSVMAGALYWGVLLCTTALFFGGKFEAVLETAGIIVAGSGTSALLSGSLSEKTGPNKRNHIVKLNKKNK